MTNIVKISTFAIGNYYGNLKTKQDGDRYYWCIENWDGHDWEEIDHSLYMALEILAQKEGE